MILSVGNSTTNALNQHYEEINSRIKGIAYCREMVIQARAENQEWAAKEYLSLIDDYFQILKEKSTILNSFDENIINKMNDNQKNVYILSLQILDNFYSEEKERK